MKLGGRRTDAAMALDYSIKKARNLVQDQNARQVIRSDWCLTLLDRLVGGLSLRLCLNYRTKSARAGRISRHDFDAFNC